MLSIPLWLHILHLWSSVHTYEKPRLYLLLLHIEAETNGRHFPDVIFKFNFLNENIWISIEISLKCVPNGQINNIPALVQIMAWRIYVSLGFHELRDIWKSVTDNSICDDLNISIDPFGYIFNSSYIYLLMYLEIYLVAPDNYFNCDQMYP